ncbi:MAG: MFS transporter, partial [Calditrichaeota bacterium]|nr:MFS transporter [Calditrichota bacterium]
YLSMLTDWNWLIGIGSTLHMVGWFFPQLFGAKLVVIMRFRLPFYKKMSITRLIALGMVALLTLLLGGSHRSLLLILFLVLYSVHAVTAGLAGLVFLDVVGKTVPAISVGGRPGRGSFFGWRIFLGSVVGIAAGFLVINPTLENFGFPAGFAILFALSTIFFALGVTAFCLIKEQPSKPDTHDIRLSEYLVKSFDLLREDKAFRRYFITRHLIMLWNAGMPFYILFAKESYNLSSFWIGAFLAARYAGEMMANVIWAMLSDRGHNRAVLRLVSSLTIFPPLVVFLYYTYNIPEIVFAATFFITGSVMSGMMLGGNNYILQHAPEDKRPMYIGLTNSTLAVTLLASGLAGLLVDNFGYPPLFIAITIIGVITLISAIGLKPAGYLKS